MTPARRSGALLAVATLVVALLPSSADAQAHVAALHEGNRAYAEGRFDEAVAAYRRAVDTRPASGIARFNLGTALAAAGDLEGAIDALGAAAEALQGQQSQATAYFNLGNALARAGRLDDALGAYRASLRLQVAAETQHNYSVVWRWRASSNEAVSPEPALTPERVQELRDTARTLDVPVVARPGARPPPPIDR